MGRGLQTKEKYGNCLINGTSDERGLIGVGTIEILPFLKFGMLKKYAFNGFGSELIFSRPKNVNKGKNN